MAKYTIELRHICDLYTRTEVENWFQDYNISDYLLPSQLETLNKFPNIWSKHRLAKKIIDHYYMREIGFETPALFKHYAKVTMQEIMESKLPLIYTLALDYDPLINVNYTETFKRTAEGSGSNNGKSNSTSSSNSEGLNINNDTPQTNITKQDINTGAYASSVNQSETNSNISDETTSNSSSTNNTNEEYTRTFEGNQGIMATYQKMIKQFRDNIRAVDSEIIKELNTLFMGLY